VPTWSAISANLGLDPFLIVLLGFGIVMAVRGPVLRPLWAAWVIGTLLHASYGQFGWNDRYQAYLVIVGIWLTLRTLPRIQWAPVREHLVLALVLLVVVLPVGKFDYMVNAPSEALVQTQVQQQMAGFLARYYDGRTVMVNDIGRKNGCLKMGSDFAVPVTRNREMLAFYRERLRALGPTNTPDHGKQAEGGHAIELIAKAAGVARSGGRHNLIKRK